MTPDVNVLWEKLQRHSHDRRRSQKRLPESETRTQAQADREERFVMVDGCHCGDQDCNGDHDASIRRIIQFLRGKDLQPRYRALKQLKERISDRNAFQCGLDHDVLCQLGTALLVVFGDGPESCRMDAATILKYLFVLEDGYYAKALIAYALPLLQERMSALSNCSERVEKSEEVRRIAVELLLSLITMLKKDIRIHIDAVCFVLFEGCKDVCAEVVIASCQCIQHLCEIFDRALVHVSKEFVARTAPVALHRQRRVRTLALQTIKKLIYCGAHEMILELVAFRNPNVLSIKEFYEYSPKQNFFGSLATDRSASVRLEFLETIGDWMLHLPERADYISRILPFIMSALIDPVAIISKRSVEILTELGELYERDHEQEMEQKKLYLPKAAQGMGWGDYGYLWNTVEDQRLVFAPFVRQPRIGVRCLVQSHFGYFVKAICSDLCSQDDSTVVRSLHLLRVCSLLLEDRITEHLREIVHALLKAMILWATDCNQRDGIVIEQSVQQIALLMQSFANEKVLEFTLEMHLDADDPHRVQAATRLRGLIQQNERYTTKKT